MQAFCNCYSAKCSYCNRISFIKSYGRCGCITTGIGYLQHVKIALQLSIFTRGSMHNNQYSIKMQGLTIFCDGKIVFINSGFGSACIGIKPAGGLYVDGIYFILFPVNTIGYINGTFITYFRFSAVSAGNQCNFLHYANF